MTNKETSRSASLGSGPAFFFAVNTYSIDFDYRPRAGENPHPWCVTWHCLETGEKGRLWLDGRNVPSPFPASFRMIAHYALAELACFLELGWKLPTEVIDTLAEARVARGQVVPFGGSWGLLNVACQFGISTMSSDYKKEMRSLSMGDDNPTHNREELMAYCHEDARTGLETWLAMEPRVDLPQALLRGRYLKALAEVERRGIPADVDLIGRLRESWQRIRDAAWAEARKQYPGVISSEGHFKSKAWLDWCQLTGTPWPKLPSGAPDLDADTFKEMADRFPAVRTMYYARRIQGQGRKFEFPLGEDGRLRCMLSAFGSDTGRNQPSTSKYVFAASAWLRSSIMAPAGRVLVYIDYSAQEVGLAAARSGDPALMADYLSGDPYIAYAIRAGAAPEGATKKSHPGERASYKVAALAIQYGIGAETLGQKLGISTPAARRVIAAHQGAYPVYWRWRQAVIDEVKCGGVISTRYGWKRKVKVNDSANSIANFPVQSAGAEILWILVIALEEAGHRVVATVHDGLLIEMDVKGWREELAQIRLMAEKSAMAVTGGLRIPTDVELILPGENYVDGRGAEFWEIVESVIGRGPIRLSDEERQCWLESQI